MTPADLGSLIVEAVPGAVAAVDFDELTVTVPVSSWVAAASVARAQSFDYLDLLTAWEAAGGCAVALQLWSVTHRQRLRLVCEVDTGLPTLTGVFPGADWHERETAEMFGLDFAGHPNLVPLLLPDPVMSATPRAPLRKEFVLPARSARPWPGEIEP